MRSLGIDWGSYLSWNQEVLIPWDVFVPKLDIKFAIYRGDQEQISSVNGNYSTLKNLDASRKAGVPINASYYWHYPNRNQLLMIDQYKKAIDKENPDFIGVDIEQTVVGYDSNNRPIIVNSQVMSDTSQQLCEGLQSAYPEKLVVVYTRPDIITTYSPQMSKWIGKFDRGWQATWWDYGATTYRLTWDQIKSGIIKNPTTGQLYSIEDLDPALIETWTDWGIWQYSSRIWLPYETGIGGTMYDHQYDWNFYKGDLDSMQKWIKKEPEVELMAGIYNQSVPIQDRANFVMVSDEDKSIDIANICGGTNLLAMQMVNQSTGTMNVHKDTGFQTWVDRSTLPVAGWIGLDQNLFWNKEIDLSNFKNTNYRNMWNNETLRAIIDQWRSVPIPDSEWNNKKLNINSITGWHKLSSLFFFMQTDTAKGSPINGMWQQAIVDDILNPLVSLMQSNAIPTIPIYVMANHNWWKKYSADSGWVIKQRIPDMIEGIGDMRVWGQDEVGLITDKAPMTVPLVNVSDFWQYAPADGYQYPFTVDGLNFQFFVFTYNRLIAENMFYDESPTTPATCGIWNNTVDVMNEVLNYIPSNPPVPPVPPVDLKLEARIIVLENRANDFENRISTLETSVNKMNKWFDGIVSKIVELLNG